MARDKIGFTMIGRTRDGRPAYVGDVRGVSERNVMRYYLAIDAYVRTFDLPAQDEPEQRLRARSRWRQRGGGVFGGG